jgi:GntR family histidine utilization transcriptional repressor
MSIHNEAGMTGEEDRRTSFRDVRDEVLARIQARVWDQGDLLPTEAELATEFGCARATVNRALRELAEAGTLDRKRKSGTRVATAPVRQARFEIALVRRTVEEMNAAYRYSLVGQREIAAPDWLAAQLGVDDPGPILHVRCMHYADDRPFQFEERWINIDAVPHVREADFSRVGPNEWLVAEVPFSSARITFAAVGVDADTAAFLSAQPGAALFRMERTTWFRDRPVTFVRMTFHPGYEMTTRY